MGIGQIASKGMNYMGRLIFDDRFASKVTSNLKAYKRYNKKIGKGRFYQFHKQVGEALKRADKTTKNKKIFESLKDSLKSYKTDVLALWKNKDAGFFKKIGGTLKGLGKRAPLLGTALMLAFELPNIFKATKDGGLINGATEAAKSGVRIAAGVGFGAIGTALLGPVGSILGFLVGDFVGKLVVGKNYSEKKAAAAEETQKQTSHHTNLTPEEIALYQKLLYGSNMNNDFLANAYFGNQANQQSQLDVQA